MVYQVFQERKVYQAYLEKQADKVSYGWTSNKL